MKNRVKKYIAQQNMLKNGDTVVLGVSGGPDSLCLLHILFLLKDFFQIRLVCAHVDHQARGADSAEDAAFVRSVCAAYRIPFVCRTADVKALAKAQKINFHQAARGCRYDFFREVMEQYGADKLALGHHGEDLAETFMMCAVRQISYEKWFSLLPKRAFAGGELIRPLFWVTKQEILDYLHKENLAYRTDVSNDAAYYTRNRFRKQIMPFVYRENPSFLSGLFRTQQDVLADEAYLMEQTKEVFEQIVQVQTEDAVILHADRLLRLPLPLQRRLIRVVLECLYADKNRSFSYTYIAEILTMLRERRGYAEMALSDGIYITADYRTVRLGSEPPKLPTAYEIEIPGAGVYALPNGSVVHVFQSGQLLDAEGKHLYSICEREICFPYMIRTRQPGDRILLENGRQHKKISRLFIDEKVPLPMRAGWPLLVGQDGQVLWVPLLKKTRTEKAADPSTYYVFQYIKEAEESL